MSPSRQHLLQRSPSSSSAAGALVLRKTSSGLRTLQRSVSGNLSRLVGPDTRAPFELLKKSQDFQCFMLYATFAGTLLYWFVGSMDAQLELAGAPANYTAYFSIVFAVSSLFIAPVWGRVLGKNLHSFWRPALVVLVVGAAAVVLFLFSLLGIFFGSISIGVASATVFFAVLVLAPQHEKK